MIFQTEMTIMEKYHLKISGFNFLQCHDTKNLTSKCNRQKHLSICVLLKNCSANSRKVRKKTPPQKMKFSIKDFFSKCDQIRNTVDLVTFTEEILNAKLHFLCFERLLLSTFFRQRCNLPKLYRSKHYRTLFCRTPSCDCF